MSDEENIMQTRPPWFAAAATFIICLLLGPPVGGMVFAGLVLINPDINGIGAQISGGITMGLLLMPFSYALGVVQAAIAGLALASYGFHRGRPPLWVALVAGLAGFAILYAVDLGSETKQFVPMLLVHLVPATLCWFLIQFLWRKGETQ